MLTIWKYPLTLRGLTIDMPAGATILTVQLQDETPTIWALVDPDRPCETRTFTIVGTGHRVPDGLGYVGTFQQPPFVWHLFEVPR